MAREPVFNLADVTGTEQSSRYLLLQLHAYMLEKNFKLMWNGNPS